MFRAIMTALVVLSLACSDGDTATQSPKAASRKAEAVPALNGPPVISAVEISPENPTPADSLSVSVQVQDPDREPVDVEVEWYRNGARVAELEGVSVDPQQFDRGDQVYVIAHASDGENRVTQRSEPVEIQNSPPRIASLELLPKRPLSIDMLEMKVVAEDADGDSLEYRYRWLKNDVPLEDEQGPRLAAGRLHRGDHVVAQALVSDGTDETDWLGSTQTSIGNAPPRVTSQPDYTLSGPSLYRYQMRAEDPDGDVPLKYELVSGPAGMAVDPGRGVVSWQIQPGVRGKFPIELAVSDPYGGQIGQRYSLEIDWQDDDSAQGDSATQPAAAAPDTGDGSQAEDNDEEEGPGTGSAQEDEGRDDDL